MPEKEEDLDIRIAAEKLDAAVAVLLRLGKHKECRKVMALQDYIHDTWDMEEELKKRADYIETEMYALAEMMHKLHGGNPHEKDDG